MKSSEKSKNDLKIQIQEEIRKGGIFDLPENSVLITTCKAGDLSLMPIQLSFEEIYNSDAPNSYLEFEMTINTQELIHNCECHKMAALCFFEWTPGGEFKQAPVIKSLPNLKYLVLGMVEDIYVSD